MNKMNNFKGKINIEPVYEELELAFSDVGPFRILVDKASEVAAYAISGVLRGDKFPDESVLSLAWTMLDLQQLYYGENEHSVEASCNMAKQILETYKVHPHFDACCNIVRGLRRYVHDNVGRHESVVPSISYQIVSLAKEYEDRYKEDINSLYSYKVKCVSHQRRIDRLKDMNATLEKEKSELQGKMKSKEFRDEVGKEYLLRMFKGYLRNAKKWSQGRRDKEYDWLEHLLKLEGIPQDVKDMIEALAEDKGDERIVNVKGNYNDIHDNGSVDIKEK